MQHINGLEARPLLHMVLHDIMYKHHFSPDEDDAHSSDDESFETQYSESDTLHWHRKGHEWRVMFSLWCTADVMENESSDVALIEMEVRVDSQDANDGLLVSLELFEDPHRMRTSLQRISNWAIRDEEAWREFDAVHIEGALAEVDQVVENFCKDLSDNDTDAEEDMLEASP